MSTALLTISEASSRLQRSSAFVRGLCHSDALPAHHINGRYYIPEEALIAFVRSPIDSFSSQVSRAMPPRQWKGKRRV